MAWKYENPVIDKIEPSFGAPGIEIMITGKYLDASFSPVIFHTSPTIRATIVSPKHNTKIIVKVPPGKGQVGVTVGNSNKYYFTYQEPVISHISPNSGEIGDDRCIPETVEIIGDNVGYRQFPGDGTRVMFGQSVVAGDKIKLWRNNKIIFETVEDCGSGLKDKALIAKLVKYTLKSYGLDTGPLLDFLIEHKIQEVVLSAKRDGLETNVRVITSAGESNKVKFTYPVEVDYLSVNTLAIIKCGKDLYTLSSDGNKEKIVSDICDHYCSWTLSPDRSKVAYEKEGDIYVMDLLKKNTVRITDNPAIDNFPFWSPDSKKLGFISERGGRKNHYRFSNDYETKCNRSDIFITNVLDSTEKNIQMIFKNDLPLGEGESTIGLRQPAWSPDGKKIAFLVGYFEPRGGTTNTSLFMYSFESKKIKRLFEQKLSWLSNISWSPDSQKIAHESLIVDINTNKITDIKHDFSGFIVGASWSPDGHWVAYTMNGDLYVRNPKSGESKQLTSNKNTKGKIIDHYPLWTNDSKKIIFERWNPHCEYEYIIDKNAVVCVINIETKQMNSLGEQGCSLTDYIWSQS